MASKRPPTVFFFKTQHYTVVNFQIGFQNRKDTGAYGILYLPSRILSLVIFLISNLTNAFRLHQFLVSKTN